MRPPTEFNFSGSPGVQLISDDPSYPLSVFKTFLTDEIISDLVEYTNIYAQLMIKSSAIQERLNLAQRSMFKLWQNVDIDEIWVHICLLDLMGIIKKPMYHMYWTNDPLFATPIFSMLMPRSCFEQIRSMLRFTPPKVHSLRFTP